MNLQSFPDDRCCLCGGAGKLTREHKIKASELRGQFGNDPLVVVAMGSDGEKKKHAQSANSKHLKFGERICEACNTDRTQKADYEFSLFQKAALQEYVAGNDPGSPFSQDRYKEGSDPYLNFFRYFAKIMCCQLAAVNAPIPVRLARFAIGEATRNSLFLEIKVDPTYAQAMSTLGEHQYAAHGGLVVYGDRESGSPNAFHSTLTVGPIQYIFHIRLNGEEIAELHDLYPEFYKWCASAVSAAKDSPLPDGVRLQLGISSAGA